MDLDFGLLADAATVDSAGKLNVLGIFDRIQAHEFPARHGRLALVLRFSAGVAEAGLHDMGIRLRGPGGTELLRLDGKMELGGGPADAEEGIKVPHILNLDGMTFPEPGVYFFDIFVDGTALLSIPLRLERLAGGRGPGFAFPDAGGSIPFVLPGGGSALA